MLGLVTSPALMQSVIEFLKSGGEADTFLNHSVMVVEQTIEKYLNRAFSNLQISFGCTGGQHRSVFCAERLAEMLSEKYEDKINIVLHHRDLPDSKS
ncbi:MAG: RNase adapter RapZ [Cyclobacteriaceae bacterium]|nr:RNase adapter RapZ [Cyclobacteriaceae bacterium]